MGDRFRFDVYGRFTVDVVRAASGWDVYRVGEGKRGLIPDIWIPGSESPHELAQQLDDVFHELASPGREVRYLGE